MNETIAVVGAGIAGLLLARELNRGASRKQLAIGNGVSA